MTGERFVVPWRNPGQFCKVYDWLFSDIILEKQWALDKITVWETRCQPSLPPSIEATAEVIRALIQDELFKANINTYQDKEICSLYSTALIRFVNLIVEDKVDFKNTKMSDNALKKDIPTWMVDVRHAATHSVMPSLSVLRLTAVEALKYLRGSYWEIEIHKVESLRKPTPVSLQEQMLMTIQDYCNIRRKMLLHNEPMSASSKDFYSKTLLKLEKLVCLNSTLFLEVLLKPGVFISIEDINSLGTQFDPVFLEPNSLCILPRMLEKMWIKMLTILHTYDLLPDFLELLLLTKQELNICQKLVIAWAIYFLSSTQPPTPPCEFTCLGKHFMKKKNAFFDKQKLFYASLVNENIYFSHLIQRLQFSIKDVQAYNVLLQIASIYSGQTINNSSMFEPLEFVYTAENVEEDIAQEKDIREKSRVRVKVQNKKRIWSMAPMDICFSKEPLGSVMNPVKDDSVVEEIVVEESDESYDEDEDFITGPEIFFKEESDDESEDEDEEDEFDSIEVVNPLRLEKK